MTSRTAAHQAPLSMKFSRQEYWSGLPCPSPGDLPDPGIKPKSPTLQADSLPSEPPGEMDEGEEATGLPHSGFLLSDLHHSLRMEDQEGRGSLGKTSANSGCPGHLLAAPPSLEPASVSSQERHWESVPALLSHQWLGNQRSLLAPLAFISLSDNLRSLGSFQAGVDPWLPVSVDCTQIAISPEKCDFKA